MDNRSFYTVMRWRDIFALYAVVALMGCATSDVSLGYIDSNRLGFRRGLDARARTSVEAHNVGMSITLAASSDKKRKAEGGYNYGGFATLALIEPRSRVYLSGSRGVSGYEMWFRSGDRWSKRVTRNFYAVGVDMESLGIELAVAPRDHTRYRMGAESIAISAAIGGNARRQWRIYSQLGFTHSITGGGSWFRTGIDLRLRHRRTTVAYIGK